MRMTVRVVLAMFLAVLILSNYNSIRILNHAIQFLELDLQERSRSALRIVSSELSMFLENEADDVVVAEFLHSLIADLGLQGIVLYKSDSRIAVIPGLPAEFQDPLGMLNEKKELRADNRVILQGTYQSRQGPGAVVLILDARRAVQLERTTRIVSYSNLILMVFAAAVVIYFFESSFRPYRLLMQTARSATPGEAASGGNEAEFLISTFNGVISRLRMKEQELELLHQSEKARADDVEQLNQDLVHSISSGLILVDQDRRIRVFNHAAESILVQERSRVLNRAFDEALAAEPAFCEDIERCFQDKVSISRAEMEIEREGQTRFLGAAIMPVQDRQQEFAGVLCLFTDITDFKLLQQRMTQKEKFASLGEMAGGVAHEFRNSLATITGYVQMLENRTGPEQKEHIESIQKELRALQGVINEFLSFARPVQPDLHPVRLKELLEECLEEVRMTAPPDAELNLRGEFPVLPGDEAMLKQVFLNLIRNAVEAAEGTGRRRWVEVCGSVHGDGRSAVIEVSDNGTGIREEDLQRIFTPFFSTKRKGVGLGLAIAQKLVLQHNGAITAESRAAGAVFRVELPVKG